ncbi:10240_t:CDS:2, partial [Gigaspora margarita]
MDFFNIFCLTIFLFICYLIIDLSQIEDEFILVTNDDDEEESVKATNYNTVNEVTANSVREKNMNEGSHEIERFRKKVYSSGKKMIV